MDWTAEPMSQPQLNVIFVSVDLVLISVQGSITLRYLQNITQIFIIKLAKSILKCQISSFDYPWLWDLILQPLWTELFFVWGNRREALLLAGCFLANTDISYLKFCGNSRPHSFPDFIIPLEHWQLTPCSEPCQLAKSTHCKPLRCWDVSYPFLPGIPTADNSCSPFWSALRTMPTVSCNESD